MSADLFLPRSPDEALSLLKAHGPDLMVMGGGTVVMGLINEGLAFPRQVMSLYHAGMNGIQQTNGHTVIGATTSLAHLSQLENLPLLVQAASMISGPALRNMATLGGNLLLPQPYGDMAVPLLAYDTQVELDGTKGPRTLALEQFLAEPRFDYDTAELLLSIRVPAPAGKAAYVRFGRRQANTPSIVAVAARVVSTDGTITDARIALGAAASFAIRAHQAEATLVGQKLHDAAIAAAAQAAMHECSPFTDALATDGYRRKMVGAFVKRALQQLQ